ncbi:PolC-type DNA polymerase III [Aerococcus kribbianus]|uniref:DNA polymerase III PolC-type n=1 Tax=Aerococcus kribbianus TaxID=2999064 RepID=A0A9X3JG28_9LACT|nr:MULTISPECIES: PolC-type DNA polymerase III [unclassified Aerococcus]MCZ0716766.1 PolC-type DNA polymerase III [Aerococcus sp. YH-aer221]MCZ0725054.1 PolC-type DNA polymerase III [Aerococcus sp. YH-aer222]
MTQANQEKFQILLKQLNWSPTDENLQAGAIENVTLHTQSRVWQFDLKFPQRLSAGVFKSLSDKLASDFTPGFAHMRISVDNDQEYSQEEVLDYWPLVIQRANISNGLTRQIFSAQLPSFEDGRFIIRTDNRQVKDLVEANYLEVVQQNYRLVGFPKLSFAVIVDQDTANDRQENFQSRQEAIMQEQQKIAQAANKRQKEMAQSQATNDQAIKVDKIAIGKPVPGDDRLQAMNTYVEEQRQAVMEGVVFAVEIKTLKTGRQILKMKLSDYTSAFIVQMFSKNDQDKAIFAAIKEGMWMRVRGDIQMDDRFERDFVVTARDFEEVKKSKRQDSAPEDQKRVELHLHTNMSMLDATNSISDLAEQAKAWGHEAIAVTDHSALQAFPEASAVAKETGLKMIYGVEANIVDDGVPIAYNPQDIDLGEATYVVFDVETTGLSAVYDQIIELAAVKMHRGNVIDQFEEFINPGHPLSSTTINLTGITDAMVADAKPGQEVMQAFKDWSEDTILVAHNASFDMGFLNTTYRRMGIEEAENAVIDTLELSRFLHPQMKSHRLNTLAKHYNVALEQHHRAVYDSETTGALCWIFLQEAKDNHDITNHQDLNKNVGSGDAYKRARPFHATILAKNQTGLKDLFKLISAANVKYYYRTPRIPRSLLAEHRENLLIGSACSEGEVFEAIMQKGKSEAIDKAKFYDYLEIMPKGIYQPLIQEEQIRDEATLEDIMKTLLEVGQEAEKMVVATGNVHYLNPEDKKYREILIHSVKSNRTRFFPEAHFRSTDEMLADFAFLGEDVAQQIVVENSQAIAAEIEPVEPLKDKLYTPSIEGAEQQITEMSYNQAKAIYGEDLPEIIEKRLEKELSSIIGNGFSVIYLISQKLVKKSNDDGYIVGSRGSVGSSFVATMMGITEVNPLSPHYVCPDCHYSYFFTDGSVGSGFDLEDKACPQCGAMMKKDGQDIPFETFLGFKGDKVPDIDLNFSGEYQSRAHAYTKVLFGEDKVFRAGTIGTVAEKTAFGYVLGYDRDNNLNLRKTEKEFFAQGATGVKRTTGQHPGGIIVIPEYMDVFDFTPIQYPADDQSAEWRTTHFDFHSIHDNVLKLDILGHDDPTMIRKLQDLSGIAPTDIPVDDPSVYELFNGTEILGVSPEQIYSKTGTLGIPEFGTGFTRQMLEATKPTTFAELLQISGLSHGTDVWLGNAEVLVREKGLPLSEVIGCRDDIMVYLLHKGLPESDAFQIMEKVRKGKGLSDEHKAIMREHDVPEWYLESCEKIKYMFPKAHAAAYVLNAMRVAWFKVHHPIWYYCAFLSVRAHDFDLVAMTNGLQATKARIKEIHDKGNEATNKEKATLVILEIVNEMQERGIEMKMVDIDKSDAMEFVILDDHTLLAPFRAVDGLGNNVARQIVAAREESEFLSKEDLQKRGKVSKTLIEYMSENHVLDALPDQNQLSLFDF